MADAAAKNEPAAPTGAEAVDSSGATACCCAERLAKLQEKAKASRMMLQRQCENLKAKLQAAERQLATTRSQLAGVAKRAAEEHEEAAQCREEQAAHEQQRVEAAEARAAAAEARADLAERGWRQALGAMQPSQQPQPPPAQQQEELELEQEERGSSSEEEEDPPAPLPGSGAGSMRAQLAAAVERARRAERAAEAANARCASLERYAVALHQDLVAALEQLRLLQVPADFLRAPAALQQHGQRGSAGCSGVAEAGGAVRGRWPLQHELGALGIRDCTR